VRLQVGKAEELDFPSESFDVVIFSWSLCCVQDMRKALRETHRVLRPGGKGVNIMPEVMSSFDMAMLKAFGGKDSIRQGSSDAWRALVKSVQDGLFDSFEEKRIFFDTYFDSVDSLIGWLPTVPGTLRPGGVRVVVQEVVK
jgi:ubiquinone/menaquinone biosynthesis C-methylase UbiE